MTGTLSATEPWGFQFDGHHLVIYYVVGDQVVMSPCFWGSEATSMKVDGRDGHRLPRGGRREPGLHQLPHPCSAAPRPSRTSR
nr:DUF3500 domain-containing protein [Streptomyces sp. DH-12]